MVDDWMGRLNGELGSNSPECALLIFNILSTYTIQKPPGSNKELDKQQYTNRFFFCSIASECLLALVAESRVNSWKKNSSLANECNGKLFYRVIYWELETKMRERKKKINLLFITHADRNWCVFVQILLVWLRSQVGPCFIWVINLSIASVDNC